MVIEYHVRIYCRTCQSYERTVQTTLDPDWIPEGHTGHTLDGFCIEEVIGE